MDREHLDRFEALERRIEAVEKKLMPQVMAELDEITVMVQQGPAVEGDDA